MSDLVTNRRAFHDYEILETYEAGMVLLGTEIKSLRQQGGSLQEAYVDVRGGALYLINASIAPYKHGSAHNHPEKRDRKLLLHKREMAELAKAQSIKGHALIPLAIYLNKRGFAKLKIGVGRGKKAHDKRASIKEREEKRAISRAARGED